MSNGGVLEVSIKEKGVLGVSNGEGSARDE